MAIQENRFLQQDFLQFFEFPPDFCRDLEAVISGIYVFDFDRVAVSFEDGPPDPLPADEQDFEDVLPGRFVDPVLKNPAIRAAVRARLVASQMLVPQATCPTVIAVNGLCSVVKPGKPKRRLVMDGRLASFFF